MLNKIYLLLAFLFPSMIVAEYPAEKIVVWNVGQGQWVTYVNGAECWHLDFGGEKNPINEVIKLCSWRMNVLILSHPDRDHYSFIQSIQNKLKFICLDGPSWKQINHKKVNALNLKTCSNGKPLTFHYFLPDKVNSKDDNKNSQIVSFNSWLVPGDAPQALEKKWLFQQPNFYQIKKLILGHHGSKTSTSQALLNKLNELRQCVASSRKKKYGHPHRDVRYRVQKHCSLILTEEWNHLHFIEPGA